MALYVSVQRSQKMCVCFTEQEPGRTKSFSWDILKVLWLRLLMLIQIFPHVYMSTGRGPTGLRNKVCKLYLSRIQLRPGPRQQSYARAESNFSQPRASLIYFRALYNLMTIWHLLKACRVSNLSDPLTWNLSGKISRATGKDVLSNGRGGGNQTQSVSTTIVPSSDGRE